MDKPSTDLAAAEADVTDEDGSISLLEAVVPLAEHWKLLVIGPLVAGLAAFGIASLIPPTYTATTTLLPPQQQQSSASSLLSSLGSLAGLAGGASALRTPADQYVALMQSATVSDRLVDRFKLLDVYDAKFRVDARRTLASSVRISIGKKDGLITVEVDDKSPQRAAEMANRYVDELRHMTDTIAVSEAQQRRKFFEVQLRQTQEKLVQAQQTLQASGFAQGALKAEPKSAAEAYARLRAELTAAEVRLQTLRGSLSDNTPEVQQQQSTLAALRSQVARLEQPAAAASGPDYVSKYREFKYQETLFDLFAKQYELARVDESREGGLIQVVDVAALPEKKSKPKRLFIALGAMFASGVILMAALLIRGSWRATIADPSNAEQIGRLRNALGRRRDPA
ncbi:MAG: Wzz/FepE/Etk N-terminal domain-containing protein [Burkholderiales bacterium]